MTPYGWIILAFVLIMQGMSLSATFKLFQTGPQKEGVLFFILHSPFFWFYFLFIFPLITMKSLSEEEKTGTMEALLTTPIKTGHVVLGKFFSAYTFYVLLWLPMLLYPPLTSLSNLIVAQTEGYQAGMNLNYRFCDWFGAYSILFLAGAFFTSIGILCSSLTSSQIIAGITTIGTLVFIYFLGLVTLIWGDFDASGIFHYISLSEHLDRFSSGLIDSRPFIFYITGTILVLSITIRTIDYRRWRQ